MVLTPKASLCISLTRLIILTLLFDEAKPLVQHLQKQLQRRLNKDIHKEGEYINLRKVQREPAAKADDWHGEELKDLAHQRVLLLNHIQILGNHLHPHAKEADDGEEEQEDDNRKRREIKRHQNPHDDVKWDQKGQHVN